MLNVRQDPTSEEFVNLRLLGKGLRWAFGIEGATALCVYVFWLAWHFRP